MSFAVWNWLKVYERWRESYFQKHPEKRLFPWLWGLVPELPDEPIITWGEKGEEMIGKTKMGVVLAFIVFLALSRDS